MAHVPLYNAKGEQIGTYELPPLFAVKPSAALLYEVVTSEAGNRRGSYAHTKGKGAVRGGGRKPWKQKGTGRARHGSIRSPIWRKGGVVFGPRPERTYKKKINRKVARAALIHAIAAQIADGHVVLVDSLEPLERKTKQHAALVSSLHRGNGSTLVLLGRTEADRVKYFKNIPRTELIPAENLNAYETVRHSFIVVTRTAFEDLIARLEKPIRRSGGTVRGS